MIEISENNPPETFEFTTNQLFQRLANMPNFAEKLNSLVFESFVKDVLNEELKSQVQVEVKNGKVKITLWQPCDENRAKLR